MPRFNRFNRRRFRRRRPMRNMFRRRMPIVSTSNLSLTSRPKITDIYKFCRFEPETILSEGAVPNLGGLFFALALLPSPTEFADMFAEYMITKIELYFYPKTNAVTPSTNTVQTTVSQFYIAYDPTNASTPANTGEVRQYTSCKSFYGNRPFKYTIYPRAQLAADSAGGVVEAAQTHKRQWISTTQTTVRYYGAKYAIPANNNTSNVLNSWTFSPRYTIVCRNPK